MEGWIKFHRKFIEWEWFEDECMVKLFLFLLLSANHKDGKWKGVEVKRGQLITGLNSLSKKLGMSIKVIRNRLDKLEKTGEIGRQTGTQYSVITIYNYDSYQSNDIEEGKQMGNQRASDGQSKGNQRATNKNDKKDNNENKSKMFKLEILDFKDKYPTQLLEEFFNYWSEPNRTKTKMRFEMEKTWDISRRLSTWEKRSNGFKKEETKGSNLSSDSIPKDFGVRSETATQMPESLRNKIKTIGK